MHGFGFASALREIGLPQTEIPAALLSFNAGGEIGQIIFVCSVIALVWTMNIGVTRFGSYRDIRPKPLDWLRRIEKPFAYIVGVVTVMWTFERVSGFWIY